MSTLLVGFDSAWTAHNSGAIVGVMHRDDRTFQDLGPPLVVNYADAEQVVRNWQVEWNSTATVQLLDQPTIVKNIAGQRPVENLAGCSVGLRCGGMQPGNRSRVEMFGDGAPVWRYLEQFGGPANPLVGPVTGVIETYPVLTMIALGWTRPHCTRAGGRLPKYNPARKKTFSIEDWQHVCLCASKEFSDRGLRRIAQWIEEACEKPKPRKSDQDGLDACICLLVALNLAEGKDCIMVGNLETGYIVVPHGSAQLVEELEIRCRKTGRNPGEWIQKVRWKMETSASENGLHSPDSSEWSG